MQEWAVPAAASSPAPAAAAISRLFHSPTSFLAGRVAGTFVQSGPGCRQLLPGWYDGERGTNNC